MFKTDQSVCFGIVCLSIYGRRLRMAQALANDCDGLGFSSRHEVVAQGDRDRRRKYRARRWHPRRESNSHLRIRNPLFYPLNYEGTGVCLSLV